MKYFLDKIERGKFRECEVLMLGLSYKGKVHESFWEKGNQELLKLETRDKSEMIKLRTRLIIGIIERLYEKYTKDGDLMNTDNYCRYLHALIILDLSAKESKWVPKTLNERYDIAYKLVKLDDGSNKSWKIINEISWKIADLYQRMEAEG